MWNRPTLDVMEMLEAVPEEEDNNPVIIEFKLDGYDEVIYRWNKDDNCWVKTSNTVSIQ